jgi:predicted deoxyguanosinetriphosphate triphosphohydrolase
MDKMTMFLQKSNIQSLKPFQRMVEKTQVMFPRVGRNESVTNRLTHSYLVASSSEIINESIKGTGVNCDYQHSLYNISLLHDIGHPPFGHEGAYILNDYFKNVGGFDDNNNNYVVLSKNGAFSFLTNYELAGILKYPTKLYEHQREQLLQMQTSSIASDMLYFEQHGYQIDKPFKRVIATEIMDEADRNTYITHDLADFFCLGWGKAEMIEKLVEENRYSEAFINSRLYALISSIRYKDKNAIKETFNELRNLFNQNYYLDKRAALKFKNEELYTLREDLFKIEYKEYIKSEHLVEIRNEATTMFKKYIEYVINEKFYPSKTYANMILKAESEQDKLILIRDMIAEQTDWFVINKGLSEGLTKANFLQL